MIDLEFESIEQNIYKYVDQVVEVISSDLWGNILLDCTKNEILVLWLLYRYSEVNMSKIAEYIGVPLNTATGIIARMEKRELVIRQRSVEDKRVVTIQCCPKGEAQFQSIVKELLYYGSKIMDSFTKEEIELIGRIGTKLLAIMKEERKQDTKAVKVKKIQIE